MLIYKSENIIHTPCKAIIHGCNCQGKMASGVALAIRNAFPEAYEAYMNAQEYNLGFVIFAESNGKLIGNLLTQDFYGYDGKAYAHPIAIKNSIFEFCRQWSNLHKANPFGIPPIASPKIGCGLGGLKWEEVQKIFDSASEMFNVEFWIYDNNGETVK